MKLVGEGRMDYMSIRCATCGTDVLIEFLGYDPAVPRFRFACKKCNESAEYKMGFQFWRGLPPKAGKA